MPYLRHVRAVFAQHQSLHDVPANVYFGRELRMPQQKLPALAAAPLASAAAKKSGKEAKEEGKGLIREEWLVGVDFDDDDRTIAEQEEAADAEADHQEQDDVLVVQRVQFVADQGGSPDPAHAKSEGAQLLLAESHNARPDDRLRAAHKAALLPPSCEPEDEKDRALQNFNDLCCARLSRLITVLNHERNMAKWNAHELTQDPTLALFKVRLWLISFFSLSFCLTLCRWDVFFSSLLVVCVYVRVCAGRP